MKDIRYALRQFANAPVFTATAVLTLAIGIGATTAIFTLVHAVLLNSLPVAKPGELYRVGDVENCCVNGGFQDDWSLFSYDKYKTFRDNTPGFVELAAMQAGNALIGVRRGGSSEPAQSMLSEFVSGNYFSMFGIGPLAGRVITPDDDRKGAPPVAVMSYRTWQTKFHADPSVVGSNFVLNGQPFTVVGIAPSGFFGDRLQRLAAFWIPLADEPLINGVADILDFPDLDWLDLIGRIKPGADPKQIEAHMQVELRQWLLSDVSKLHPGEREMVSKQTLHLAPGGAGVQRLREEYESGLHLLMWISALVLTIACANVAT
jgi:putative ABC transport system permease protein